MAKDWIGGNAAVFNPDPEHYARTRQQRIRRIDEFGNGG